MRRKSAALVLALLIAITGFGSVNIYAAEDGSAAPAGNDTAVLTEDTAAEEAQAEEVPAVEEPEETLVEEPAAQEAPAVLKAAKGGTKGPEDEVTYPCWVDDMYYTSESSYYTAADGPVSIDGKKYYFKEDGHLKKGEAGVITFNDNKYYVTDSGVVATGKWVYIDGKKVYYARSGGALYVSTKVKVGDYYYIFSSTGKVVKGPKIAEHNGHKYYVNQYGVVKTTPGVVTVDGTKYYVTSSYGRVKTTAGIVTYTTSKGTKVKYYVKKDGTVRTTRGILTYKNSDGYSHKYYVKDGGRIRTAAGFVTYNGSKYYVRNNGRGWLATSTMKKINGSKYIFASTGKVRKGIVKYDGNYYYCYTKTGKVRTKTGMYQTQDKKAHVYVASTTGKLATKKIITIDGTKYIFKSNARRASGITLLKGNYYFCSPKNNGAIRTKEGKFKYKTRFYYAKSGGVLYRNEFIVNDETVYHATSKAYLNTGAFTSKATSGEKITLHPNPKTARIPFDEYVELFPYPAAPSNTEPCVLVDISDQTLYFYRSGKLVFKTPVVTGKIYGVKYHGTPIGTFRVQYKQRDTVLKGLEDDGKTKYESPVSYWMPFTGNGYGLHDATWRSSFGGTIYQYSGSHGCVNMPYRYAQKLFNSISAGCLVKIQQ